MNQLDRKEIDEIMNEGVSYLLYLIKKISKNYSNLIIEKKKTSNSN